MGAFRHVAGETLSIVYFDLTLQDEFRGVTGILVAGTAATPTVVLTKIRGAGATALTAGTPTVVGTGDKLNGVVQFDLNDGTAGDEYRALVTVTWSGGGVKSYCRNVEVVVC